MFTEDERRLLERIKMSKEETNDIRDKILLKSTNKKKISKICIITGVCVLLLVFLLPPVQMYAEELWKKSWFYSSTQQSNSQQKQNRGDYIVFPDSILTEDKVFSSVYDVSKMLSIPLLECDHPVFDEVYYQPSMNDKGKLVTLHLWGHNKQDAKSYIPKNVLYEEFTKTLTKAQREQIEQIYSMSKEDIASYYSTGLSYSITMYSEESGVKGDVRVITSDKNSSTYFSKALKCDILIEQQLNMDGTYTTSATWIKNNILYRLMGYRTVNDMKKVIEGMHY